MQHFQNRHHYEVVCHDAYAWPDFVRSEGCSYSQYCCSKGQSCNHVHSHSKEAGYDSPGKTPREVGEGLPGRPWQISGLSSTLHMFAGAGPVRLAGGLGATPPFLGALSHPADSAMIKVHLLIHLQQIALPHRIQLAGLRSQVKHAVLVKSWPGLWA